MATSFFDPVNDDSIASVLTRTLLETNQEIPECLQLYVPDGDAAKNLRFETESDYDSAEGEGEVQENSASGNDAWGGGQAKDPNSGSGWGAPEPRSAGTNGFEESAGNAQSSTNNGWGSQDPPAPAGW